MKAQQSGFTLVEIAIVLVIIGLLLGGVLKGQELITQAKIKNLANDLNGITAAVYAYQDRFKTLPGDDPKGSRWTDIATLGKTGAAGGDGDGSGALNGVETQLFWAHLRKAGFIAGDPVAGPPLNAAGGQIVVMAGGYGIGGTTICMTGLNAKMAEALDTQTDDGSPAKGVFRADDQSMPAAAAPDAATKYVDDGSTLYSVCKQL
ncbi:prepilin-type N-terminal cleavage/methylation domain-containing protein [Viridibacterium curvum]|uniref:Prepilin-type N-terminal cleavage/methylation domain-containing protein n=1 Tax=Viridibacterium curvum TaxID=1101404 RepID=A0ABP9R155_9RHOO